MRYLICFMCVVTSLNAQNLEPYSELKELLPYHMLSFFGNEAALKSLVARTGLASRPSKVIIEVGSYLGASTKYFASVTGSDGRVYAIDWWQGLNYAQVNPVDGSHQSGYGHTLKKDTQMYDQFLSNMIHLEIADIVYPVRGLSVDCASILTGMGVDSADLVYIDADHSYTSVLEDCRTWYPFVANGQGILCGDDYGWSMPSLGEGYIKGVRRAVNQFAKENNLILHTNGHFWWLERRTTSKK